MLLEALPLIVFTTCSGIAAGMYIISTLMSFARPAPADDARKPWLIPLVALILLGVGLLGSMLHLGQPLRFINGLSNPSSMISQEAYWSIGFGIFLLIHLLLTFKGGKEAPRVITILGSIAALGLIIVTSLAYYFSAGVPSWSSEATLLFFFTSDFVIGAALYGVLAPAGRNSALYVTLIVLSVMWAIALLAYGFHMAALGYGSVVSFLIAGAAIGPVAAIAISAMSLSERITTPLGSIVLLVLVVVAAFITRWVFFTVGLP